MAQDPDPDHAGCGGRQPAERPSVPLSWLHALSDVGRAVNRSQPLAELLDLVAGVVCRLTGYDFAAVFTPDDPRERLLVRGVAGFPRTYAERINDERPARLGGQGPLAPGPAARAFTGGLAVIVPDITADATFRPWAGAAREQGFRSVACVPLVGSDTVGVLACYTRAAHDFPSAELALLAALGEQAAIAIESADLRRRQRDAIAVLQRAEDLHRRLMGVVVADAGLDALARALSGMLPGPVLVTDGAGAVLASAGLPAGAPARPPPTPPGEPGDAAPPAERVDADGRRWLCAPVVRGGEELARVWTFRDGPAAGPLERRVLDNGALVVSLELAKQRAAQEVAWRLSGDLLGDVLEEPPPEPGAVRERAARLSHDLELPHTVLAARPDPGGTVEGVLALVRRGTRTAAPRPLVGRRGSDVVVLWPEVAHEDPPSPGGAGRPSAADLAGRLRRQVRRDLPGTTVSVAVGAGPVPLADLAAATRTARRALDLSARRGARDRLVALADLGVERLLLQVSHPEQLTGFVEGVLGPLVAYDRERDGRLLATLQAYLEADCNTAAAAERLTVHPNTVAYRLRRVTELSGLDLSRTATLLEVGLALRLMDLTGT
jgi:sugar diacid utilization regulator